MTEREIHVKSHFGDFSQSEFRRGIDSIASVDIRYRSMRIFPNTKLRQKNPISVHLVEFPQNRVVSIHNYNRLISSDVMYRIFHPCKRLIFHFFFREHL